HLPQALPADLPADWENADELQDEWDGDGNGDKPLQKILSPQELAELKQEMERLREFLQLANSIDQNSKGEKLLEALRHGFAAAQVAQDAAKAPLQQKAVIFTE